MSTHAVYVWLVVHRCLLVHVLCGCRPADWEEDQTQKTTWARIGFMSINMCGCWPYLSVYLSICCVSIRPADWKEDPGSISRNWVHVHKYVWLVVHMLCVYRPADWDRDLRLHKPEFGSCPCICVAFCPIICLFSL